MNKLGFGFLRLPMNDNNPDYALINPLVDAFLAGGGTYFDTAYTYLGGKSEEAIRESLVKRHPRESFQLADKLPGYQVKSPENCRRFFEESCARCGVDYFDVFMLHWLNRKNYETAEAFHEFEFLSKLKAEGKAKRIGFSFHDTADLLDEILTNHPETDCVLLQINYLDWESASIQSRQCYEVALRHGKSVMVMEPVKGGTLATVCSEARLIMDRIDPTASPATLALRFAQSLPGVEVVLSGMNAPEQIRENLADLSPMTAEEMRLMQEAAAVLNRSIAIPCTGCGYCVKHCPQGIAIPDYFRIYNDYARSPQDDWKIIPAYNALTLRHGKASDCTGCGNCEANCPQKLAIREHLSRVSSALE